MLMFWWKSLRGSYKRNKRQKELDAAFREYYRGSYEIPDPKHQIIYWGSGMYTKRLIKK